ncbi:MAG: hypothetical protein AB1758_01655 [Candidatus Eremiobacterota bacterium]
MKAIYTGEDLLTLGLQGRFELLRGELVPLTPPGFEHGEVASNTDFFLKDYARRTGRGRVVV